LRKTSIVAVEQAIAKIEQSDNAHVGFQLPLSLLEALVGQRDRLRGLRLTIGPVTDNPIYRRLVEDTFLSVTTICGSRLLRAAFNDKKVDYLPCNYSELSMLARTSRLGASVILLHVTVPDSEGYCCCGTMTDYTFDAIKSARLVIAEANDQMPRTLGKHLIHLSEIDYLVESSHSLDEITPVKIGEIEKAIGTQVANLVPDGATLQLGLGSLPDAICAALTNKKGLGVHSGLMSAGLMQLAQKGVITNEHKTLDKGKMVGAAVLGTKEFYQWVERNPFVEFHPWSYTHDIRVLSSIENFVAINSALQVDLTGQVNTEAIDNMLIGTVGGMEDFLRGALVSPGGKAIIVLPSKVGNHSTIIPQFERGAPISVPRADVEYIVTEYGAVNLKGKSIPERAKALLSIAHPEFREGLEAFRRANLS